MKTKILYFLIVFTHINLCAQVYNHNTKVKLKEIDLSEKTDSLLAIKSTGEIVKSDLKISDIIKLIPNEEDLIISNDTISFNNRDNTNGYGYKIIREMFDWQNIPSNYSNSIWELRYEYDLQGNNVIIPDNVILFFNGGRLSNYGTITGSSTIIATEDVEIFDGSGSFSGFKTVRKLSWYGASNSKTPLENYEVLRVATLKEEQLIIDKVYDIDASPVEIQLPTSFKIYSNNREGGFNITNEGTIFKGAVTGNLFEFKNLTLISSSLTTKTVLFRLNSTDYYEFVDIQDNYFKGYLQVLLGQFQDADPSTTNYGINNIEISYNKADDLIGEFVRLEDNPSASENIRNNIVNNLQGTFYRSSLENTSVNRHLINDVRTNILIENNKVFNDIALFPNNVPSTYLSLAVIESLNVIYTNNHVEGLKTQQSQAIYDVYLSCTNVRYTYNKSINNVCFDPVSVVNNQIIKSKDNVSLVYDNPLRYYVGNTWIITQDFLDNIGKTSLETWVNFYEIPTGSDFVFNNNYIDIFGLVPQNTFDSVNSLSIKDNIIRLDYIKQSSAGIFMFNRTSLNNKETYITGNNLSIMSDPLSNKISFFSSEPLSVWSNITIKDNNVSCLNQTIEYCFNSVNVDKMNIYNNYFNSEFQTVFRNCSIRNLKGNGNTFNTSFPDNKYISEIGDFIQGDTDFKVSDFNSGDIHFAVNNNPQTSLWNVVEIILENGFGKDSFWIKYRVYDEAGVKRISLIDEDGLEQDFEMSTNANNTFVKLNRTTDYNTGVRLLYVNHPTAPRFQSSSELSSVFKKSIHFKTNEGLGSFDSSLLFFKKTGVFDYNDLSTTTTPISVTAGGGYVDLTNDELGAFTNKTYKPTGVSDVWDSSTNSFDFTDLTLGSSIQYRLDIEVTTTTANQEVEVEIQLGVGGNPYSLEVFRDEYKTAGVYKINVSNLVYMGDLNTLNNGGKFRIQSDGNADVKVNGWAVVVNLY